ncbi:NRDE family protein [Pseudohalioglobus lutimaris]|uniref:NRDE family protein n=1 Tax=Pseudohalioglobus lutimaris TaxID=1737061 RepID=A0A2N5X3R9_9GAMM|nr:NRDE family protein [Pseudohalioglobus lutimaris]PLW69134.1 hypothetical protein C0039_08710 [Pseudohalioglobus lutimaris]
MCLILFAYRTSAAYPLMVAANRDEFHARPTAPAGFWDEHPDVFAGRDLQAGGTWMGINRNGRFAAVTNYRDPQRTVPGPRTRGELTTSFLAGKQTAEAYLREVAHRARDYAGFNLLLGEAGTLWYYSNSTHDEGPRQLRPGIYGLSNARLDTPWPKILLGKQAMQNQIHSIPSHNGLASAVSSRELASPEQLQAQGLDSEMDQLLSSQFIVNPTYGTRATTTLWQDAEGRLQWRELNFSPDGLTEQVIEQTLAPA